MRRIGVMLMLVLFAAAGCSKSAITVDDIRISKEVFDLVLKERLESHKSLNASVDEKAVRKAVADELVGQALLVREAKRNKIVVTDEEVRSALDRMRGTTTEKDFREALKNKGIPYRILQERVKENLFASKLLFSLVADGSVTDEDAVTFYRKSPVPFMKPGKEFVSILQIYSEEEAKKAEEVLKKGADFDAYSKELTAAGKANATNYGWLDPDTLPSRNIAADMKTARLNVSRGPFKGKDGSYYFFMVKDRQIARVLPYDDVKEQVRQMILNQRRQELAGHIIETARKTAKIKVNV